jgi:hypothetical protein
LFRLRARDAPLRRAGAAAPARRAADSEPPHRAGLAVFHTALRLASTPLIGRLGGRLFTPPADRIDLPDFGRLVAKTIAASIRGYDLAARCGGGEEFCIVLPDTDTDTDTDTDADAAIIVAEHVRAAVFALTEPYAEASLGVVTVSIGVAALRPTIDDRSDQLIETADAALYEAKRGGRNQVASATATVITNPH